MFVTNLLWLNVNWPDIWPPIASRFQPQPVLLLLFCNRSGSYWGWSVRAASREARCRDWDGGQDGRGASSFTSYMRVQSSDSLWECWVVCRRENAASAAVVSGQDVQSFLCTVVTLWIMQWSHTHRDVSMDMALTHTRRHAHAAVDIHAYSHTEAHIITKIMWRWLFFFVRNVSLPFLIALAPTRSIETFFFSVLPHPERFHSNYDCTAGND